ncbi:hypothetical protein Fmac_009045 [Flemingia macrophylla]|uniref:Uncharacterized protein n=1 Tax=Flemingia macrophylla TaxID=520843 RepID=A0ABD1N1K6_9FABA
MEYGPKISKGYPSKHLLENNVSTNCEDKCIIQSVDHGSEIRSNLPTGVLIDQQYVIAPRNLNEYLFSLEIDFLKSLAEVQGNTELEIGPWKQYVYGKLTVNCKAFGIPIVARLCNVTNGSYLYNLYLKWFHPLQNSIDEAFDVVSKKNEEVAEIEEVTTPSLDSNANELDYPLDAGIEFYITNEKGTIKNFKILMNEPLEISGEDVTCACMLVRKTD